MPRPPKPPPTPEEAARLEFLYFYAISRTGKIPAEILKQLNEVVFSINEYPNHRHQKKVK